MKHTTSAVGGSEAETTGDGRHPPADAPRLLCPPDAARALNVSERTLFTLTKGGGLPAVRIGRAVRYDPADLRRFVERAKGRAGA